MDNNTFRKYLEMKLEEERAILRKPEITPAEKALALEAIKWLEKGLDIAKYQPGAKLRAFRRDYERKLSQEKLAEYEAAGVMLNQKPTS